MSEIFVPNGTNVLEKVIVCSPKYYVFNGINEITKAWMEKGETEQNDQMVKEWDEMIAAYEENGVEVVKMDPDPSMQVQTFARDFGGCVKEGAIIGKFRHPVRRVETAAYEAKLKELGVPVIARCNAGCFEGGDIFMIDEHTIAFGMVDRTDRAGVDNLREQLAKFGYTVVGVPCPPYNLHLDMVFNIVAEKTCIACLDELPYEFIQMLKRRNFEIIPVESELMYKHGCNVQALGDGKVLAIKNNKSVNDKMRALGLEVIDVDLCQLLKAGGGPHCSTFPVKRKA